MDAAGNTNNCSFDVTISGDGSSELLCLNTDIMVDADAEQCEAEVYYPIPTSSGCPLPVGPIEGFQFLGTFENHSYYLSDDGAPAPQAYQIAIQHGGHLATITSEEENLFLGENCPDVLPWIGARYDQQEASWEWVTGESFDFTDWFPSLPEDWPREWVLYYAPGWFFDEGIYNQRFIMEFDGPPVYLADGIGTG
jgi:hypothetical protein